MPSIVDQVPFNEYVGNGVSTVYGFEFQLLSADDLVVEVDGVAVPASDYTLAGLGAQGGGTVTFDVAPANGAAVLISREIELARATDYQTNGDLFAEVLDLDFNRVWQALQEQRAVLGSSVRAAYPRQITEAVPVAGGYLRWKADLSGVDSVPEVAEPGMYIFGAPGAVARSVSAKLDEWASIMDFGGDSTGAINGANLSAIAKAHATGRPVYLPGGNYYFSDHWKPPAGSHVILIGEHRDKVTITGLSGRIPVFCDATPGVDNRIAGAFITGITFDGGHVRDPAQAPYNAATGNSLTQALNLRGVKGEANRGDVTVTRCRFKNINGLPVWIADFNGSVEFSHNHLYRTKDPGFLYNDDVKVLHNTIEFAADNGISVSRSNKRVVVDGNTIRDCASSGIFVGGVFLTGTTGSLTISGASYAAGAVVSIAASANTFSTEDVGISMTLRSGADRAIVRITSVSSQTAATGTLLRAAPASLQAVATADWSRGPVSGAQAVTISKNVIDGGANYGIHMSAGCKDFSVHGNIIRRAGMLCDSEVSTIGTIVSGSTTLTLASAAGFAINDWIVVEPDYTYEDTLLAQIVGLAGNVATLSVAPTQTYASERVYRATRNSGSYGILLLGRYENSAIFEYAEQGSIVDNIIVDPVTGGMRIGSTSGSVRNIKIADNTIHLRQVAHTDNTRYGILLGDSGATSMRTNLVGVSENSISMTTASGTSYGVRYQPVDADAASYIRIGGNRIRQCTVNVSVIEQAGATDITAAYSPSSYLGSLPVVDQVNADTLAPTGWAAAGEAAGVVTCTQTLHTLTPGAPLTVTDIATSGIDATTPVLVIRNASATQSITFTFNAAKIRTLTGADVVVPPYGAITFVPISSGLVQQI
jgi:hypothetical protein